MNASSKIFLVDDDAAVRDGLTLLLETAGHSVAAFPTGEHFLEVCSERGVGCLILDMNMPGMDGLTVHATLIDRGIRMPVIYLTAYGDIPATVRAMKAGAVDFLTKPVSSDELLARVREALALSECWQRASIEQQSVNHVLSSLTEREREVMALALEGLHNKEIARRLNISYRTVEIHRARVMHKTGTTNLLELARIADTAGQLAERRGD